MTNDRNHTFFVDEAWYTAEPDSVEKVIKLRLPAAMFIPFKTGTDNTGYGIGVDHVVIREYRYQDEDDNRFDIELKGHSLTKAGFIDKRSRGMGYHFAWADTTEDVDRLLAALPEQMKATMLDGITVGFTRDEVEGELRRRVTRIAKTFGGTDA